MDLLLGAAYGPLRGGGSGRAITGQVTASTSLVDEGNTVTLTFEDTSIAGSVAASNLFPNENETVTLEFGEVANEYQWINGDDGTSIVGQIGLSTDWTATPDEQPPRVRVTNPTSLQSRIFAPPPIEVTPFVPTIEGTFTASTQTPVAGGSVTFEMAMSSVAVGSYTFQLTRNNVAVPGATTNPFTRTLWEESFNGNYRMVVTDTGTGETRTFGPISVTETAAVGVPTLLASPAITGALTQNSELTFDVGLWADAVSFEIELVSTTPTATLIARQSIDGATSGSIETVIGSSLVLRVWATNVTGTTYAESDAFGPIEAQGDVWVGGFALRSVAGDPTPIGSPVSWIGLHPNPAGNPYTDPPGYGWLGFSLETNFASVSKSDTRLQGRFSPNVSVEGAGLKIKLPDGPGTYIVHAGLGHSSNTTPNLGIYNGDATTTVGSLIYALNADRLISCPGWNTMDIVGNVRPDADWVAASVYGGSPLEIEVTGDHIYLGRPPGGAATQLNCFAILKKAVI